MPGIVLHCEHCARLFIISAFSPSFLHHALLNNVPRAMLIPPLARAACRPGLGRLRTPLSSPLTRRVFATSPIHRKDGSAKPVVGTPDKAKTKEPLSKEDKLLAEKLVSNKEQRKADWAIMKEMTRYLWPKDSMGTRLRVGLSVGLLIGAKLLNVQIPFYFKSIVDAMNIDFLEIGGTAWTVAGSMIVACKLSFCSSYSSSTENEYQTVLLAWAPPCFKK